MKNIHHRWEKSIPRVRHTQASAHTHMNGQSNSSCFHVSVCSHLQYEAVQIFQVYREPRCGQIRLKGERTEENKTGHWRLVGFTLLVPAAKFEPRTRSHRFIGWLLRERCSQSTVATLPPSVLLVPVGLLCGHSTCQKHSCCSISHYWSTAVFPLCCYSNQSQWMGTFTIEKHPQHQRQIRSALDGWHEDRKCSCLATAVSPLGGRAAGLLPVCCQLTRTNNQSWTLNGRETYLKMSP